MAWQLVEKTREHDNLLFDLFVDLRKAHNSVPRHASWRVLKKFGVPPVLLSVIYSFHVDLTTAVCVKGQSSDSFKV